MPAPLYDYSRKYTAACQGHVSIPSVMCNLLHFYIGDGKSFKMNFLAISGYKSINSKKMNN